jgi:hypothetical protein
MVVNFQIISERLQASLAQFIDWLLGFDADGDRPVSNKSKVMKFLADIEGKKQSLAEQYKSSCLQTSIMLPNKKSGTRTINYWSESGHFWRWQYNETTIQDTFTHIMDLADDPTMPFTFGDAMRAHELLQFMELTMDCQDVVGL